MINLENLDFTNSDIPLEIAKLISDLTDINGIIKRKSNNETLSKFCQDNNTNVKEISKMLRENKLKFTLCKVCGNKTKKLGNTYCSCRCRNLDKDWQKKFSEISLQKYGTNWPSASKEIRNKVEQTNLEKYGACYYFQTDQGKQQYKQTCLEKYGVDNYFKTEQFKQYIVQYNLDHYGVPWNTQAKQVNDKRKQTWLEHYDVDHPSKNPEIYQKVLDTKTEKYGPDYLKNHLKQIVQEQFGVENYSQTDDWKVKFKQTSLKNYGTEHPNQNKQHKLQGIKTRRKNRYPTFCKQCQQIGYTVLSSIQDYIDGNALKLRHSCGREIETTGHYIQLIPRCVCECHQSKQEGELLKYVQKLLPNTEIQRHNRTILEGLEMDIYIPSLKLAFEYNGDYWHNSLHIDSNYHLGKTLLCSKKGIVLIHIFEYQWKYKKSLCKNLIKSVLGLNKKITNYQIKDIDNQTGLEFIKDNALDYVQLFDQVEGLYYKDQLVSIKCYKDNKLVDTIDKVGYTVLGSLNVSHCNMIINESINISEPQYCYIKRKYIIHQSQINSVEEILKDKYSDEMTDEENMLVNYYNKVYNCGKLIL